MLFFQTQNEKKIFVPTGREYSKQQTRVMTNQHIFKSGASGIKIAQTDFIRKY